MWGMSPIDQMICRIQFRQADYRGEFTPPRADKYTVEYPGYNGGSDWGSVSIDPVRGVAIANYNDMPNYLRLMPRASANKKGIKPRFATDIVSTQAHAVDPQWGVPYAIHVNAGWRMPFTKLLCKRPPYGGIRAIDIATGKTLVGPPARHRAAQRAVQHPDPAAVHHRHAQQRRRGDDRERPDLHRRGDRRSAARDRRAHRQGRVVGGAPGGRAGDADDLPGRTGANIS